jgi:hypothetical protein
MAEIRPLPTVRRPLVAHKPAFIAWLVIAALLRLPASATAQWTAPGAGQSTIFPSLSGAQKQSALVWSQADMKRTSPTRNTVFQTPEPFPDEPDAAGSASVGASGSAGVPVAANGGATAGTCPHCGEPLDHPILGTCDNCSGRGGQLLCLLRPGWIFGGRGGPVPPHDPWITRPFSFGVFVGPVVGSPLIDDWVGQQTGTVAGARFGWDMDDDWGLEMRLATANIPIYDSEAAIEAQLRSLGSLPANDPNRFIVGGTRNADHFFWDIDFLYYPWGDSYFRPYLLFGLGTDRIKFTDRLENEYARILLGIPVGLGMKMHLSDWMIFRIEFTDSMALAGGSIFQTQHSVSFTGALEVRFGRPHILYWPWNPGR